MLRSSFQDQELNGRESIMAVAERVFPSSLELVVVVIREGYFLKKGEPHEKTATMAAQVCAFPKKLGVSQFL